jgi:hypothetical protein
MCKERLGGGGLSQKWVQVIACGRAFFVSFLGECKKEKKV